MSFTFAAHMGSWPGIGDNWWGQNEAEGFTEVVSDPSAPFYPAKSLRFHYNENTYNSGNAGTFWNVFETSSPTPLSPQSVLYISMYFNYSSNYQWHPVLSKMGYFRAPPSSAPGPIGNNDRGLMMYGIHNDGTFGFVGSGMRFAYWSAWPGPPDVGPYLKSNVNSSYATVNKDQWHHLEMELHSGTVNGYNGSLKAWLNGHLIHDWSNVPMLLDSGNGYPDPPGFGEFCIIPVWGGNTPGLYSPAGGMDQWFHEVIVSNAPIGSVGSSLAVTTTSLPAATQEQSYSQSIFASGGTSPYSWSVMSGTLPAGLSFSGNTISGTPIPPVQTYTFTMRVTDSAAAYVDRVFSILVNPSSGTATSNFTVRVTDSANATDDQPLSITINPSVVSDYTDNFNRANENPLSGNWSVILNASTWPKLLNNQITSTDGVWGAWGYRNTGTYSDDQYSQFKLTSSLSASVGGPAVRVRPNADGSANGYYLNIDNSTTAHFWVAYGSSELGEQVGTSFSGSFVSGDTFKITVVGNILTVYQNGNVVAIRTDTNNRLLYGGRPGINIDNFATWDDWAGGNVSSGGSSGSWVLTWSDDFNYTGLPDPTKWGYETGYRPQWSPTSQDGNGYSTWYSDARLENSRVENGNLVIEARADNPGGTTTTPMSYSTSFPLTELDGIAEGTPSKWINGQWTGIDWTNVKTSNGNATGTQVRTNAQLFDDSVALIKGTWSPDQSVEGIVHAANRTGTGPSGWGGNGNSNDPWNNKEVELILRGTILPHSVDLYEINFSSRIDGSAYQEIGRWNGAIGTFSYGYLSQLNYPGGVADGDTVKATIIGDTIRVYHNGNLINQVTVTVDPIQTGNPGIGFYSSAGSEGTAHNDDFGFQSILATDLSSGSGTYQISTACVSSRLTKQFLNGRIEIRAKLPTMVNAADSALWFVGTGSSDWPAEGEVDLVEYVPGSTWGGQSGLTQNFHTANVPDGPMTQPVVSNLDTEFHVYTMDYNQSRIILYVDGVETNRKTNTGNAFNDWPFSSPMFLYMDIEPGDWAGGGSVATVDLAKFPMTMYIDYVRYYEWSTVSKLNIVEKNDVAVSLIKSVDGLSFSSIKSVDGLAK
jgi:hypothetical protein